MNPSGITVEQMVNADSQSRIDYINRGTLIQYPKALIAINRFNYIIRQPPSHRMIGGLLHGPSGNGKTTLLEYIVELINSQYSATLTGEYRQPVLYVDASIDCDDKQFLLFILKALKCMPGYKDRANLFLQVIQLLRHLEVKVFIIIDEFQQLLDGTHNRQRTMLTTIKMISNMARIPIIGAGLDNALYAVAHDPQLFNRLRPISLPIWTTDKDGIKDFRSLLKTFEVWLPLRKPSNLSSDMLTLKISELSKGLLGEIAELLRVASIYAIESGEEQITIDLLNEVVNVKGMFAAVPKPEIISSRSEKKFKRYA